MVDVFDEVEEQLRQDRYQEALKKWGPIVGGVALAIILVAAGWQWWVASRVAQAEAASMAYLAAVDQIIEEETALAQAGLQALSEDGNAGYRTLALLQRAGLALDEGDRETAATYFDEAASSTSEPLLRDLAQLKSVWARWDELSFADIEIRLSPLAADSAPYRFLARESIGAAALRAGDLERAESEYQILAFSFEVSDALRRRAQEALAAIAALQAVSGEDVTDEQATTEDGSND